VTLRTLAVAATAGWVGITAFFSFVVAPLVFRTVDRGTAAQAVAAVLPRYYLWGAVLTSLALLAYLALAVRGGSGRLGPGTGALLCAIMLAALLWAWLVVLPRAEAARRARRDTAFARAHREAVQLNGLTLAAGVAVLALEAVRRGPPRSR
jgi:hypothetical protein